MGDYNRRNNNNSYRKKRNYNDFQDDYKPLKSPDEETVDRITNSLFRLGEKRDFKLDVEDAVVSIEKDYQLNKVLCLTAIKGCLYQVPYKISIFASLTGLLNAKNFDLGADIIQIAAQLLNEGLDLCQFRKVKLMVRFFSECVNANVILPGQLITLYDNLLSVANEVGASQERTDAFAFIVMASIPWASATLKERSVGELERLLNDLETYMSSRDMNSETVGIALANEALSVYRDCGPEEPYQKFDRLDLLWIQLQNLKASDWETPLLLNIAHIFKDGFERQIQHEIPQIIIPTSITIVKFLYQPKFLIFDDKVNVAGEKKICNLPSTSDISRFMLDDCITDTIRIFSLNHKECAELLLSTQHYFNTDYIESQGYQVYESVVETIFAELFRFPKTHEKAVYYTTLIIDLCKESLDKIPSVLGRCIKLLFSRLDSAANPIGGMDVECIKRFSDFFAQHLSNFGFSWKWSDWEFVLDENTSSGQFVFIRETLQKCVRLAYYDRIKNSIPESFETHGKIFPTSAPSFHFKFQDATIVGDEILTEMVSHGLNGKISGREDVAVVENALEGIHQYLSNNNSILSNPEFENTISRVTHEALIQCIMFQGSKSFSHLLNVIERYLSLLQKMNEEAENRLLTIKVISSFWQNNFQFLEIILGKLLNYRVVDPKSILTWLLSSEILEVYYDHFFLWTILSSTLSKINLKAEQISAKLQTISADPNAENAMHDDSMDNIHSLNVALEASHREKKETVILCFQKFVQVLSEKLEQDSDAVNTPFWRWVSGFMRQTTREFQTDVDQLKFTLEAVVFTNDVDESILSIWKQAIQVYNLHGEDIA